VYCHFTAIDNWTRLRVLRIYPTLNQATAIQLIDLVIQRPPFQVEVLLRGVHDPGINGHRQRHAANLPKYAPDLSSVEWIWPLPRRVAIQRRLRPPTANTTRRVQPRSATTKR
jgi:hypothetical protein